MRNRSKTSCAGWAHFDTFFVLTVPPENKNPPLLSMSPRSRGRYSTRAGVTVTAGGTSPTCESRHRGKIREMLETLIRSARKLFGKSLRAGIASGEGVVRLSLEGNRPGPNFEPSKLFKFYYSDLTGTPDVGFAAARIIAETYAGI